MDYDDIDILLTEDSMDDAALTIRAFKKGGFTNKLHHVINGAEALDFLFRRGNFVLRKAGQQPKVIFLDLKMPKVSGVEVLAQIKNDPELKSIPVIILTSSKEDPDIKKCYQLGANSYIVKPVESQSFFQTIKELGLYWMQRNQLAE
jgi:two-component system response regulator